MKLMKQNEMYPKHLTRICQLIKMWLHRRQSKQLTENESNEEKYEQRREIKCLEFVDST